MKPPDAIAASRSRPTGNSTNAASATISATCATITAASRPANGIAPQRGSMLIAGTAQRDRDQLGQLVVDRAAHDVREVGDEDAAEHRREERGRFRLALRDRY
jgi:hypothetical protein